MDSREMRQSGAVTLTLDMYSSGQDVYLSVYNAGKSATSVTLIAAVSDSGGGSDKSSTNLPLIAGIGGFFAIALAGVVIGCVVFTCKRRRMRRIMPQETTLEQRGIPLEKVESMFPQRQFQQYSHFKVSDTCSVCLERFKATSQIRVLPCKHLYHTTCIDLWFKDNHVRDTQICCLCKMDCHNFTEETEAETGILDKVEKSAELFVQNLDETLEDANRNPRRRNVLSSPRRR